MTTKVTLANAARTYAQLAAESRLPAQAPPSATELATLLRQVDPSQGERLRAIEPFLEPAAYGRFLEAVNKTTGRRRGGPVRTTKEWGASTPLMNAVVDRGSLDRALNDAASAKQQLYRGLRSIKQGGDAKVVGEQARQLFQRMDDFVNGREADGSQDWASKVRLLDPEQQVIFMRATCKALRPLVEQGSFDGVTVQQLEKLRETKQANGWNFDWDDNIFNMPTQILLTNKTTGEEVGVSTAEFALVREEVGKTGKYQDYESRSDAKTGALRRFGDDSAEGDQAFGNDVDKALSTPGYAWQGPSWHAFQQALGNEETAKHTTLITARMHAPESIRAGLEALQRRGLIKYLPPLENIYPVNCPKLAPLLGGSASSPAAAKAKVMMDVLDKLNVAPFGPDAYRVTTPDAKGKAFVHLWGFSDDDFGNFSKAVTVLSDEVKQGRWPNVKISVFFTGKNHPTERPGVRILQPDGTTRPARPEEAVFMDG